MQLVERLIDLQCEVTDRLTYYLCGRKPGTVHLLNCIERILACLETLTFSLPDRPKLSPLLLFLLCLTPDDFTHQGRVSGWERVNNGFGNKISTTCRLIISFSIFKKITKMDTSFLSQQWQTGMVEFLGLSQD